LLLAVVAPTLVAAQQSDEPPPPRRALTLDEAIRLAAKESEQLQIARAGVRRAGGQLRQARSGYLPQLNSNLTYARALRSQFSALASSSGPDTSTAPQPQSLCTPPLSANPTPAERAAALAAATTCPSPVGIDFSRVGFGARNSWNLGLSFSQNVFTGGRLSGLNATAVANERGAQVELTSERAQLALDVTQAYFDAVLADRLVQIADTSLAQTEELLRQTTVARQVGNTSEFELLRATVTRDNQRPQRSANTPHQQGKDRDRSGLFRGIVVPDPRSVVEKASASADPSTSLAMTERPRSAEASRGRLQFLIPSLRQTKNPHSRPTSHVHCMNDVPVAHMAVALDEQDLLRAGVVDLVDARGERVVRHRLLIDRVRAIRRDLEDDRWGAGRGRRWPRIG